ncbi:MAG: cytochrome d ubiquinol oxidase subunit II, partial [Deltaproteobacteria bacterium]|nr:cytochrome d ubiquinol oxidase subunit II [Deltaproteobacteria bacterium]
MDLNILWFILITVLFIGYFVLEGFDYGVGMLMPFLGKTDIDRRVIINTIGPHWDGNEVWLLTAGGAIFAAFPQWYATLFSGFFIALLLMLVGLIIRAVAFEYRSKHDTTLWRTFWDWIIFLGSFLPALIWGVAVGNFIIGAPIDATMTYTGGGFFSLLTWYPLVGGLTWLALFSLIGALFISLKTKGNMEKTARAMAMKIWVPTVILVVIFFVGGHFMHASLASSGIVGLVLLALAALSLLASGLFIKKECVGKAFIAVAAVIVLGTVYVFYSLFPNLMISTTDAAYNL